MMENHPLKQQLLSSLVISRVYFQTEIPATTAKKARRKNQHNENPDLSKQEIKSLYGPTTTRIVQTENQIKTKKKRKQKQNPF